MADSQVPWGVDTLAGTVTEPAWKSKPSFYLVATEDKLVPPSRSAGNGRTRQGKVTEVPGSHVIYVSKPVEVAKIIEQAAAV
jgi:pimeloyl-ACP methyl ester carboxylesterase